MVTNKTRRYSRQRQVILEELRSVTSHPTAAELYEMARRRLPKMSLATVYRNLELLAAMGEIQKLDSAGKESRFDGNAKQHHHVRCVLCGRVGDVTSVPLELAPDLEQAAGGYHVIGYSLEFTGLCPKCKSSPTAGGGEMGEAD